MTRLAAALCTALMWFSAAGARAEDTVRIAVASSFKPTLDELTALYSRTRPTKFVVSDGSSGTLYEQIRDGKPFDLFLSADTGRPAQLERDKFTIPGTRVTYAVGQHAQDAVLLKAALRNSAAQAFLQYLLSADAQAVILKAGYTLPDGSATPVFPFAHVHQ